MTTSQYQAPPRQPPPPAPGPPPGGPGPGRHAAGQPRRRRHAAWTGSVIAPVAAGVATLFASTALTGVIRGGEWFLHILITVLLVGCTGLALRSLRSPALAVGFGQLAVLVMLITGLYTSHGILGVFPGPAAMAELSEVLSSAGEQIRTSVPPVEGTPGILCLATIGIGLVAVVVDTLAVSLAAPAAAGLVLLCLYAVPASLADEMLPWWSFAIGAAAFAALIAVDGNHRHRQWRGRGPRASTVERAGSAASLPAAVVATAMALGLLAGATLTAIGTVGHLPFTEEGSGSGGAGALGLQPMTRLQGLLGDQGSAEVFRVEGLEEEQLLRAFTLNSYEPNVGWQLSSREMPRGTRANSGSLPTVGNPGGPTTELEITPINWQDIWLPVYGKPRQLPNVGDNWIFDKISGSIYSEKPTKPEPYTLHTSLQQPTAQQLQSAPLAPNEVAPIYSRAPELTFRLEDKIRDIVGGKRTPYAKTRAIWDYFINTGGFTYDLETDDAGRSDALEHFVLDGKRGFCSQFASAMAVMVRSEGIPARVAVGFTAGTDEGDYRSITTKDAHAWVEVYLGSEHGWVAFDPTPLAGGRGITPPYLDEPGSNNSSPTPDTDETEQTTRPDTPAVDTPEQPDTPEQQANTAEDEVSLAQAPSWAVWPTLLIILLAIAATVFGVATARQTAELRAGGRRPDDAALRLSAAGRWLPTATAGAWLLSLGLLGWMVSWWLALLLVVIAAAAVGPALLREAGRNTRLHDLTQGAAAAPRAAWRELLAECADRGTPIREADTVRETAQRLASEYNLDAEGRSHLHTVVTTLERSWYGGEEAAADPQFTAAFEGLRRSLHASAPLPLVQRLLPSSVLRR